MKKLYFGLAFFLSVICCLTKSELAFGSRLTTSSKATAYQYFLLGVILEAEGDLDTALNIYKQVLNFDPNASPEVYYRIASIYVSENKPKKAELVLKNLIKKDPKELSAYLWLLRLLLEQGNVKESNIFYERLLKEAIEQSPNNGQLYFYLGQYYLKQGQKEKAIDCLKKSIKKDIIEAEPYFLLGALYYGQGDIDAAISYLKTAIQKNPNYDIALNYLGYIYLEEGKNLAEAKQLIERALKINPGEPAYLDSLGWLYYKEGQLDKALGLLKKAAVKEDAEIYYHLGMVYKAKGEWEKAKSYLGLALAWCDEKGKLRDKILQAIKEVEQHLSKKTTIENK